MPTIGKLFNYKKYDSETMKTEQLLKDDINFLENPIWVVNEKNKSNYLIIDKENGKFEVKCHEGLPTRFDKIVLYYLLFKALKVSNLEDRELELTKYEILKGIGCEKSKRINNLYYSKLDLSLKRWFSITVFFDGIFYEDTGVSKRMFHILDDTEYQTDKKKLIVRFNEQYLKQLRNSKFCKYINFEDFVKLKKSISARLFEILSKSFYSNNIFKISINKLAEKLTLSKPKNAKDYYPSVVDRQIRGGVNEINKNTDLQVSYKTDKERKIITFKQECNITPLEQELLSIGFKGAKKITGSYSKDKIQEKINLMKKSKADIYNPTGWLTVALQEDWDHTILEKQQKEQEEVERKRKQQIKAQQREQEQEDLDKEFRQWLTEEAERRFDRLYPVIKETIKQQREQYVTEQKDKDKPYSAPDWAYRDKFLKDNFLTEEDKDFNRWKREVKQIESA